MFNKTPILFFVAFILSTLPSIFSIADEPFGSGKTTDWVISKKEVKTNKDMEPHDAAEIQESPQLQTHARRTVNYRATTELLTERYPYALMSYLSELDTIVSSEDPEKQIFAIFRVSYLHSKGFRLVTDPEAIPEQWRPHFIGTRERTGRSGNTIQQIIGQISIPNSNIKARVFKFAKNVSPVVHEEGDEEGGKVIIALSGEKSGEALQCLVTQSKPSPQSASSACSLAEKHLQAITELAESFKSMYPEHSLEITGYSFSGAIAQAVMSTSEFIDQAYIFNSYGIHPSWLKEMSENRLARIHHSYVEGSFLHGQQDYNLLSRYSRWKLPQNKVVVAGMMLPSDGLESHIQHIYKLNHHESWLDTFYNYATSIWVLHSKESVLRVFETHLKLDLPW